MAKISWFGQSCFQINISNSKEHSVTIVIDPFDETIGLKVPSLSADLVLVTHNHHTHNNIKAIKGNPFLIQNPGEYEIKKVYIEGILAFHDNKQGAERGEVTIYTIKGENLKFCHLGGLGQSQLFDEQLEKIGAVDILMIPVGGVFTISAGEAQKIISQIEPKIVIPMHYQLPGIKLKLEDLKRFLKIMGENSLTYQKKLLIKEKNLPKEGMEIIPLLPQIPIKSLKMKEK